MCGFFWGKSHDERDFFVCSGSENALAAGVTKQFKAATVKLHLLPSQNSLAGWFPPSLSMVRTSLAGTEVLC